MFKQTMGQPDLTQLKPNSIVLMFSGGLDSTAALHQLIHNEQYKDHPLHLHHIRLINQCYRYDHELEAVNNILAYYQQLRQIEVSTSFIEIPIVFRNMLADNYVSKFIGGYFASSEYVYAVAYGVTKNDRDRSSTGHLDIGFKIQKSFTEKENLYPVGNLSKAECYQLLPEKIRQLTFSCRIPRNGKPCGACTPCLDLKEFT